MVSEDGHQGTKDTPMHEDTTKVCSSLEEIKGIMALVKEHLQQPILPSPDSASFWSKFMTTISIDHKLERAY